MGDLELQIFADRIKSFRTSRNITQKILQKKLE